MISSCNQASFYLDFLLPSRHNYPYDSKVLKSIVFTLRQHVSANTGPSCVLHNGMDIIKFILFTKPICRSYILSCSLIMPNLVPLLKLRNFSFTLLFQCSSELKLCLVMKAWGLPQHSRISALSLSLLFISMFSL
jgi:hypothetical protein